jgi:hypothetical protein
MYRFRVGAIIYTSMEFSRDVQLPQAARPILVALLALQVDLVLDTVAIRLGLWTWHGVGADEQWFGVPWANVWAWFIVVWSYSGFILALRPWQRKRRWYYPLLAAGLSLLALMLAGELYRFMAMNSGGGIAVLVLIIGSVVLVFEQRPVWPTVFPSPILCLVPLCFHGFALVAGLWDGIFVRQPILGLLAGGMLIGSALIHLPILSGIKTRWDK